MSHTPEPWAYESRSYRDASGEHTRVDMVRSDAPSTGYYVALCDDYHAGPENEHNARRIVACVNACAGLTPEQVAAIQRLVAWFTAPTAPRGTIDREWLREGNTLSDLFPRREATS